MPDCIAFMRLPAQERSNGQEGAGNAVLAKYTNSNNCSHVFDADYGRSTLSLSRGPAGEGRALRGEVLHAARRSSSANRRIATKGPSGNNLHIWVSDDGWLWSISKRKNGGIPRVFRGFFALKAAADGRQLAPKCASYFLAGPKAPIS